MAIILDPITAVLFRALGEDSSAQIEAQQMDGEPSFSRCIDCGASIVRRSLLKQPALSAAHRHLYDYPTPSHLNVLWGFGSLGGIGLHVQIVTGIVLAMHYTPHVVCAAVSIEHILREVYAGHVLRHAHANGASLFFIAV